MPRSKLLSLCLMVPLFVATISAASERQRRADDRTAADIVDHALINYKKADAPVMADGNPTEVQLGLYVMSLNSVSEITMDFSMSMYFRQAWQDPRLKYDSPKKSLDSILIDKDRWDDIWVPDVFFRNEKKSAFHHVTVDNRLMRLNATGHIWYVIKLTSTFDCPMDLHSYPMDKQSCPMMFESFAHTTDTLYFTWLSSAVDVDRSVMLPQFTIEDTVLSNCSANYTAGSFPCLQIDFILSRDVGYFVLQVFVPSTLVVCMSWLGFWLPSDAVTARVILGLFTVLTVTTQSTSGRESMPPVSYVRAIDVWMFMALIFVLAALLESVVVSSPSRNDTADGEKSTEQERAMKVDKISRVIFPVLFFVFIAVYSITYTV